MRRLIPAYAGKTGSTDPDHEYTGAHPRVCGENALEEGAKGLGTGSSPRMRGKHSRCSLGKCYLRLIPAYAGKTLLLACHPHHLPAHPRVCGENEFLRRLNGKDMGSSPRMRGKLETAINPTQLTGLIPAYAGKTLCALFLGEFNGAHPRVCGENIRLLRALACLTGSSPRMRGKL